MQRDQRHMGLRRAGECKDVLLPKGLQSNALPLPCGRNCGRRRGSGSKSSAVRPLPCPVPRFRDCPCVHPVLRRRVAWRGVAWRGVLRCACSDVAVCGVDGVEPRSGRRARPVADDRLRRKLGLCVRGFISASSATHQRTSWGCLGQWSRRRARQCPRSGSAGKNDLTPRMAIRAAGHWPRPQRRGARPPRPLRSPDRALRRLRGIGSRGGRAPLATAVL